MSQHMFFLKKEILPSLQRLADLQIDNSYIVLSRSGDFADIAQYSKQYSNIKLVSVPYKKLNPNNDIERLPF